MVEYNDTSQEDSPDEYREYVGSARRWHDE